MPELTTLGADAAIDDVVEAVRRDGGVVVADVMTRDLHQRVLDETAPWVDSSPDGRDDFSGFSTTRTGALVARSPACRDVVMHPLAVSVAESFLGPYTNRIQLHLTQIIRIKPGQKRQPLHRDRLAWGGFIPGRSSLSSTPSGR
jgi:hypothetical protein